MRRSLTTLSVALLLPVGLMPATVASAGGQRQVRYYEGPTSDGGRLRISVVLKGGVPYLNLLLIDGSYSCEDGTQGEIVDDGVGWFPRGPAIEDAQIDLSENWGGVAFMVSGHLGSLRGSGTLTFLIPTLTADEQAAQLCTLGEVTWTVERTDMRFSLSPTMTVEGAGERMLAMGIGGAGARGSTMFTQGRAGSVRHYRGRTAQDRAMTLRTSRKDAGIAMDFMDLGYLLGCDDGTEVEGGMRPLAYLDAGQVMPPGRLDLDIVRGPTTLGIGLSVSLHLHGELDRHLGSGTLTLILPALTDDLQAQLCGTGDQTWRLWRTDAGF